MLTSSSRPVVGVSARERRVELPHVVRARRSGRDDVGASNGSGRIVASGLGLNVGGSDGESGGGGHSLGGGDSGGSEGSGQDGGRGGHGCEVDWVWSRWVSERGVKAKVSVR
jgi:hypothetical protein